MLSDDNETQSSVLPDSQLITIFTTWINYYIISALLYMVKPLQN